jgi:branched-chain amino acid aminotransferase
MVEKTKKIWLDGKMVAWDDAKVHVLTHTLHYGMGAFEGIRCYETSDGRSAIFRLKEHIRRMFDGLKILTMDAPFTEEEIFKACVETVEVNGLKECYIRPLMFCGEGAMGVYAKNPTRVTIAVWPWGPYLGEGALDKGIRAKVSSFNRHHVNVGMVQGKLVGQYINSILAKREAVKSGYDEAILLDLNGYVAEASGENLFVVRDGVIRTPPVSSPILAGITRDTVIKLSKDLGYDLREEAFTRDFMYICDEVFMTGTAAEVTPVREVDDRPINGGRSGEITKRLQKAYFDVVRGQNEKYKKWLTYVEF